MCLWVKINFASGCLCYHLALRQCIEHNIDGRKSVIFIIFLLIICKTHVQITFDGEKKNSTRNKKLAVQTAIPYGVSLFCADERQSAPHEVTSTNGSMQFYIMPQPKTLTDLIPGQEAMEAAGHDINCQCMIKHRATLEKKKKIPHILYLASINRALLVCFRKKGKDTYWPKGSKDLQAGMEREKTWTPVILETI